MKEFKYEDITLGDIDNNNHLIFICDGDKKSVVLETNEDKKV